MMQIRFDGPPSHVSGRFIEVEDDRGRSIKVGEWRQDGPDWLLVIPYDQDLRSVVAHVLSDLDYFLAKENEDLSWKIILPRLADRLRFALNSEGQKGETCGECGRPLDCVCHPAHPKGIILDELKEERIPGPIGEKLNQIIAEASAFSEFDVRTDDAFRLIVKLAQDAQGTADRMLERILLADQERLEIGAAQLKIENLTGQLATALRVQNAIRQERSYAEEGRRRYERRLDHVTAQLSTLHGEFRTAAQRLKFLANWLTYTFAKGTSAAGSARGYAAAAKEVLDKGLDWLVTERGRGVMDSTAASKSAGEGSSPSVRAKEGAQFGSLVEEQSCRLCASLQPCIYANWSRDYIWLEVEQRLEKLALSDDHVWNVNQQRAILNLMWHYRKVEERGAPI